MRFFTGLTGCLALVVTTGCATMIHAPLTETQDKTDRGVRYYGLSPYLIAYSNGKGGVVADIRYLPDPAKKMSVRPDSTLADLKTALNFDHGVLTSSSETGDATVVTKAVISAVEKLGTALITANLPEGVRKDEEAPIPAPYIYRIVVKNGTIELVGGNRPEPFRITLLPQPPPKKEKGQ